MKSVFMFAVISSFGLMGCLVGAGTEPATKQIKETPTVDAGPKAPDDSGMVVVDAGKDAITFPPLIDAATLCPATCAPTDYAVFGGLYDCNNVAIECTSQWSPTFMKDCAALYPQFCSPENWGIYCATTIKTQCRTNCIEQCNGCNDDHLCSLPSYACKEICQQE